MSRWPVFSLSLHDGCAALAMVTKRAYRISRGLCSVDRGEPPPLSLPAGPVSDAAGLLDELPADTDAFAPLKPYTDVLLRGSAHSTRGPVRSLPTSLQIAGFRQQVHVWGARAMELGIQGRLRFSAPLPFDVMPLVWGHAYGGRDAHAERRRPTPKPFGRPAAEVQGTFAYPRNPVGRGFFLDLDRERLEGAPVPSLEDPEDPVTTERLLARSPLDWLDRPVAACYEPVGLFAFPRLAYWLGAEHLSPARPVREVQRGLLRPDQIDGLPAGRAPDPRAYQCSAAGFAGVRLHGAERVRLVNLHPSHEALDFSLPGESPRLLLEPPGCGVQELPPLLQTVLFEPEEDRVTLTWAGTLEVAAPYPEELCREMRSAVQWTR